jgi:hypothetical protein
MIDVNRGQLNIVFGLISARQSPISEGDIPFESSVSPRKSGYLKLNKI